MADLTLEEWNSIYGRATAVLGSELSLPQRPSSVEQLAAVVDDLADRLERAESQTRFSHAILLERLEHIESALKGLSVQRRRTGLQSPFFATSGDSEFAV